MGARPGTKPSTHMLKGVRDGGGGGDDGSRVGGGRVGGVGQWGWGRDETTVGTDEGPRSRMNAPRGHARLGRP